MSDHTRHDMAGHPDEYPPLPGHNAHLVYIEQTRVYGLHCHGDADDVGCGWFGGSFRPDRWREKHMREAWAKHTKHIEGGGTITHGVAANVVDGICECVNCSIAHRKVANAAGRQARESRR